MNIQLKDLLAAICFGSLLLLGAPSVSAPTQYEVAKLLAEDASASNKFGYSVTISGNTAVIGARYDDDNGARSGSAFLFVRSGGVWSQQAKLLPSDGAAGDQFGGSVATSGTTAVIGAWQDDDKGWDSGSAYVFDLSGATGIVNETAKLLPSDGRVLHHFGHSVAVSGTTAVVGAIGLGFDGWVYVFDLTAATGTVNEVAQLVPSDYGSMTGIGHSVSVSGTTAVIGAGGTAAPDYAGAAYLFNLAGATGTVNETAKLLASDGAGYDNFGSSVAVSGTTAVINARSDDDNGPESGSAYLFDLSGATGIVNEVAKLLPSDGATLNRFGSSVAIEGTTAVIGVPYDDDNGDRSGSAYLFDLSGATGIVNETAKLLPSDGVADDGFGRSVAVSGSTALIGLPGMNDVADSVGSVYIFDFIVDEDDDGVPDNDDFCADTAMPEGVPTVRLRPNRWALMDDDSEFDTVIQGKGEGPNRSYIIEDTAGCSCEQIIAAQGLGLGHTYHGCSIGAMDEWVELVTP